MRIKDSIQTIGTAAQVVGAIITGGGAMDTAASLHERILLVNEASRAAVQASSAVDIKKYDIYARRYETAVEGAEKALDRGRRGSGLIAGGATLTLMGLALRKAGRK